MCIKEQVAPDSTVPRIHVVQRFLSCIVTEWVGGRGESSAAADQSRVCGERVSPPFYREISCVHPNSPEPPPRPHTALGRLPFKVPPTHSVTMQERKRATTWIRGTAESKTGNKAWLRRRLHGARSSGRRDLDIALSSPCNVLAELAQLLML